MAQPAVVPAPSTHWRDIIVADPGWDWRPTPPTPIMVKGVRYPSATAALQAYMAEFDGRPRESSLPPRFLKHRLNVDRLLLSSAPPRGPQTGAGSATYEDVKQMVDAAYSQFVEATEKKLESIQQGNETLRQSQLVLDNLSSLSGMSSNMVTGGAGSASTEALLQQPYRRHRKDTSATAQLKALLESGNTRPSGVKHSSCQQPKKADKTKQATLDPGVKSTLDKLHKLRIRNQSNDFRQVRSQDDLDLLQASSRKQVAFNKIKSCDEKVKSYLGKLNESRAPSWVEELAETEVTSVAEGGGWPEMKRETVETHHLLHTTSRDAATSPHPVKTYAQDDSILRDGRLTIDIFATPQHEDTRQNVGIRTPTRNHGKKATGLAGSMTTDDLLLTSPDGKYIYNSSPDTGHFKLGDFSISIEEKWKPGLHFNSDFDASFSYVPEGGQGKSLKPPQDVTPTQFKLNHQPIAVSVRSSPLVEPIRGNNPMGSMLSNAHHREFIQQLMKEIEDSDSSVATATPDMLLLATPVPTYGESTSWKVSKDESVDFLDRVRSLLSAPPTLLGKELRDSPSTSTDIVLDGDRTWEKALPAFKPPVYLYESPQASFSCRTDGQKDTFMKQFMDECLASTSEGSPTLTGHAQPGSMEALKNMLFTVQTMVPAGGEEQNPISSSEGREQLLNPSDSDQGTSSGVNLNAIMTEAQAKSRVPEHLQHLLSNSFENQQNTESLDKAMEHLNVLKSLVDIKGTDS